jgi:RimJ/RimL family protein N-acetyltransferase
MLRGPRLERTVVAPMIRTPRLVLRPHRLTDAEDWYAIQSDPDVIRYLSWPARDRHASRTHLRHRTRHTVLSQVDDFLALAVEFNGILIGDVSLNLRTIPLGARSLEIGWLLNPGYGHQGYATEAARALLRFAFRIVGADWVHAQIHCENTKSLALSERLGFECAATRGSTIAMMVTSETFRQEAQVVSFTSPRSP